jgi:transcriptional regulator with XRE-family HTH domain
LGAELRRLRTAADISVEKAAESLECSASKISRLETGLGVPRARDVRDLVALIGGEAEELGPALLALAEEGRAQAWYHDFSDLLDNVMQRFIDMEASASDELVFGGAWVPGLLQTPGYAAALFRELNPSRSDDQVRRLVDLRMGRKEVLTAGKSPLRLTALVDESVLLRSVGGPTVMREQLEAFRTAVEDPFDNVELTLLPFSAGMHKVLAGDLTVLRFTDDDDVVLAEGHTAQGFEERPEAVQRAVDMFESALGLAVRGTQLVDRLSERIEELRHAESVAAHTA